MLFKFIGRCHHVVYSHSMTKRGRKEREKNGSRQIKEKRIEGETERENKLISLSRSLLEALSPNNITLKTGF